MNKNQCIKIRVSPDEKIAFETKAEASGMSLSDFIRHRLHSSRVRQTSNEREIIRHLARIGANLNQIARWANTHKNQIETIEIILALERLQNDIKKLTGVEPCT